MNTPLNLFEHLLSGLPQTMWVPLRRWLGILALMLAMPLAAQQTIPIGTYALPGTATVTIPFAGQIRYVSFTTTAPNQYVNLNSTPFTTPGGGCNVQIYQGASPGFTLLSSASVSATSGANSGVIRLPAAGAYTIRVVPVALARGTLTLKLYTASPNVMCGTIPIGTAASPGSAIVTLNLSGQTGFVTFTTATPNQYVNLNASPFTTPGGGCYVQIYQGASPGVTLLSSASVSATSGTNSGVIRLPVAGAYTIRVVPVAPARGTLTLKLYTASPNVMCGTIPIGTAASPGSAIVTLNLPGQTGFVTFTTTAPNQRINLNSSPFTTPGGGCSVGIYQGAVPGTTQLAIMAGISGTVGGNTGPITLATAGTYTIRVFGNGPTYGTLTLKLSSVPPVVVTVTVSPKTITLTTLTALTASSSATFTAAVTGTANTAVTWTTTGGTITTAGVYSTPSLAGTYSVTATSVANTLIKDTATVTVVAPTPIAVSGVPAFPADSVFSAIKSYPGGTSKYQLVVIADMSRVPYYTPAATDPYFLKYYASFWANGKHAKAYLPNVPNTILMYGFDTTSAGFWGNITGLPGDSGYVSSRWYNRIANNSIGGTADVHIMNKMVGPTTTYLPWGSGVGGGSYYADAASPTHLGVSLNFRIQLPDLDPNGYPQNVNAGEVKDSGWGVVPSEPTPVGQWIWIVPNTQSFKIWGDRVACVGKLCSGQCQTGMCSNQCWNTQHGPHIIDPNLSSPGPAQKILDGTLPLGGGSPADIQSDGKMWYVDPTTGNVIPISDQVQVKELAGYTGWVNVNGSLNSVNDALKSAMELAKAKGRPMVFIYMAQGTDYGAANNVKVRDKLTWLLYNYSKAYGTDLVVSSHSWSSHIVESVMKNIPNVTHYAINPAHGDLKAGEDTAAWANSLTSATSSTKILAGALDMTTIWGGGSAWLAANTGVTGNNAVYNAINSNVHVDVTVVPGATHTIDSMVTHGAMTNVILPVRPVR